MTTAFRFTNVSGRVHHALSAREARANPLTSSGLKSAHRTRTLKPDGAFPDTQSSEGCCAGRRAQAQPSTASAFKIVPIAYRRRSRTSLRGARDSEAGCVRSIGRWCYYAGRATKVGRRGWGGTNVRVDAMVILPFEP